MLTFCRSWSRTFAQRGTKRSSTLFRSFLNCSARSLEKQSRHSPSASPSAWAPQWGRSLQLWQPCNWTSSGSLEVRAARRGGKLPASWSSVSVSLARTSLLPTWRSKSGLGPMFAIRCGSGDDLISSSDCVHCACSSGHFGAQACHVQPAHCPPAALLTAPGLFKDCLAREFLLLLPSVQSVRINL